MVLAACTIAPLAHAAPAAAAGYQISRTIYLASEADVYGGMANLLATPRRITLAQGTYSWTEDMTNVSPSGYTSRDIFLAAGDYEWNCVVQGWINEEYLTDCSLKRLKTGDYAYVPAFTFTVPPEDMYNGMPGNWIPWHSNLVYLHA